MTRGTPSDYRWLLTGDQAFAAMVTAIDAAHRSARLESYIHEPGLPGDAVLAALERAAARGVKVWTLVDAFGSINTPTSHFDNLRKVGGVVAWFNPLALDRFVIRNHRKLLVCDEQVAFIGGFNLSPDYAGDGVTRGWRDLGMEIRGPLAGELAGTFDVMFAQAEQVHPRFLRLRRPRVKRRLPLDEATLFQSCPGRGRSPLKGALLRDFTHTRQVRIIAAYFLPTIRLRRALQRLARSGGRVQLILPGPCDIPLSQLAAHSLYQRLLRAGVEIYEYQPQILHAKLILTDQAAYVGSANLDTRSLHINYELLLRLSRPDLLAEAHALFDADLSRCRRIEPAAWSLTRTFWTRLRERWAHFVLASLDPFVARRQLRLLR